MVISRTLAQRILSGPGPDLKVGAALVQNAEQLNAFVLENDWLALRTHGRKCIALGKAATDALRLDVLDGRTARTMMHEKALQLSFRKLEKSGKASEILSQMEALSSSSAEIPARMRETLMSLSRHESPTNRLTGNSNNKRTETPNPIGIAQALAATTRGYLAVLHSEFNASHAQWGTHASALMEADVEYLGRKYINKLNLDILSQLLSIQKGLVENQNTPDLWMLADTLDNTLKVHIPRLARIQAASWLRLELLKNAGRGGDAEEFGEFCIEINKIVRETIATIIASHKFSVDVSIAKATGTSTPLADKARKLPLEAEWPKYRKTAIADIDQSEFDSPVCTSGFIEGLIMTGDKDGPISEATLFDPSSGARIKIGARYVNWPHQGVVEGTYVKIYGTKKRRPRNQQGWRLMADRFSLSNMANESWRMAFQHISDPWFQPLRNNTAFSYAIGPHGASGSDIEDSVHAGAAELYYLPKPPRKRK